MRWAKGTIRWDDPHEFPETINDPVIIPAYGVTDVERAYWNAKQDALEYDRYPTLRSDKHCTSGVIHRALEDYKVQAIEISQAFFWGQVGGLAETVDAVNNAVGRAEDAATACEGYKDQAQSYANSASGSVTAALNYASAANLSKLAAESAASTATTDKRNAEAWAIGTRDGVPVSSDDPAYHNNAKYYAEIGSDIIDDEEVSLYTTWSSYKLTADFANKANLVNGKVPASELPSYVDDIIEGYFTNDKFYEDSLHTIEILAESGKIYITLDTNKTYRWSGTAYVEISNGDMLAQDYDSTSAVANAGGIPAYVAANAMTLNGSNAASHVNFSGAFTVGARSTGTVGTNSTCEGRQNVASGDCAHAEGRGCDATGENAHAEGCGTEATNEYAHAEGLNSVASGGASHAEGYNTTASLGPAHAEGNSTTASGIASHAEGDSTTASGRNAHSEGEHTTASGDYSHAEGYYSTASGDYSHASGNHVTAAYANQTSIGKYNINYAHHLFSIGNGTDSNNTKNAFEVWNTGDVSFDNGTTRFRMRRIKKTVTLSTSADTNVTFTDTDYIDSNAVLSVYTDVYGMNPTDMSVSNNTCTVTFPQVDTAVTINVILEISGTMSQVI